MSKRDTTRGVLAGLPDGAEIVLPKGASLILEHAIGGQIDLCDGTIWLTEPGRPRDIFLRDGQHWVLGSDDRVVLTAWAPSRLRLAGPAAATRGGHPR